MRKGVEEEGWQSGRWSLGGGSSKGSSGGHWMEQITQLGVGWGRGGVYVGL